MACPARTERPETICPLPGSNDTVNTRADGSALQWAVSVRSDDTGVEKSYLASPLYQPSNRKPSRVGSAGLEAVPPRLTVWACTAEPPAVSNDTVNVALS